MESQLGNVISNTMFVTSLVSKFRSLQKPLPTCVLVLQISYAIPIILRCTVGRERWRPGVWNLGRLSLPIAVIAATWQARPFIPCWYRPKKLIGLGQVTQIGNKGANCFCMARFVHQSSRALTVSTLFTYQRYCQDNLKSCQP